MKKSKIIKYVVIVLVISFFTWIGVDIITTFSIESVPPRPKESYNTSLAVELLFYLENPDKAQDDGVEIDNEYIITALEGATGYINGRSRLY